ncbi:Golgi apparatus membrane protein TVP38 [Amanita muscaria]
MHSKVKNAWSLLKLYTNFVFQKYKKLHLYGKALIWALILFYACIGALIILITPSRIAQYLYDQAAHLASTNFGWLVLIAGLVVVSFPPLIGQTTVVTLCGFAYGMKGFYVAAFGSVLGSSISFFCLRSLFRERLRGWSANNKKWKALEEVVRAKGIPLIILIRLSPFPPWVYSNSLFASIETVKLWQFTTATICISPKLLLHVFIGSKIAALSDGTQRGQMDLQTKIVNALFVAGGLVLALLSGWLVYTLVQGHIRHLKDVPPDVDELAAEAIEDFNEEAPLLSSVDHNA